MISNASPMIDETSIAAVVDVLKSGMLVQGDRVEQFERSFASYIGTKYAVAVNSGTAALHTALLALGISSGDEVITTPFSFIASANSILFCGAKPVFVDIDERTFNIDTGEYGKPREIRGMFSTGGVSCCVSFVSFSDVTSPVIRLAGFDCSG